MAAKLRYRQKDIDNFPCPICNNDRKCEYRHRESKCKDCRNIELGKLSKIRDTRVIKECFICGEEIKIPYCLISRKKFCSIECRIMSQKGRKLSKEHKIKIGKAGVGRVFSLETRKKISASHQKLSIKEWKEFATEKNTLDRRNFLETYVPRILKRDNYTCQICGKRGSTLHVDHIQSFSEYVDLRFDENNLRTLCQGCHYKITFDKDMPKGSKWGMTKNGKA